MKINLLDAFSRFEANKAHAKVTNVKMMMLTLRQKKHIHVTFFLSPGGNVELRRASSIERDLDRLVLSVLQCRGAGRGPVLLTEACSRGLV